MTNQSSRFIGNIPENYDTGLGPRIFFDYADELTSMVGDLNPGSVLELAAGTGIVTRRLRNSLPTDCTILASDLNAPMLEVAKNKFNSDELVKFETVDACNLMFDDESFDVIVCQFGIMFFPDKEKSYSEVLRALKSGGHYVFNVWGSWEKNPYAEIAHNVIAEFFPDDPPGFYRVPFGYHDIDLISDAVIAAGFENVTVNSKEIVSNIPSAPDFAQGIVFGNPVYEEIINRHGNPEEVRDAVQVAIHKSLGDRMPLQAIFFDAVKR
ncbi:MAG: SAM-dependent methyltransferase [Parasphingorhabdus sp.]|jgi:SAM-dependent methyltransferase